jgi:hypothetical protein
MTNPQVPFSTTGGYGGSATLTYDPNTRISAANVDTVDGYPVLNPALNPSGGLLPNIVDPAAIPQSQFWAAYPEINAILVEFRVISQLLIAQMGATQLDLQIMRADEAWNTNPNTGVL